MSNDDLTHEVKQRTEHAVRSFFQDPKVAEAVVNIAVRKRPVGWSKRSNAPYFKEVHALQLKEVIDEMLRTREDQVYFYKDFPRVAPNTVYLRINQALSYLVEFLDTEDHLYAKWSDMVNITRERNVGVRISFRDEFRDADTSNFKPRAVQPKASIPKWKEQVDDYLDSSRVTPLHIDGLMLTPDEIKDLRDSLIGLKVIHRITASEIKIIKTAS